MNTLQQLLDQLRGRLVVSCQAAEGDPFRNSDSMARFALAAVKAGAAGIRANGAEDVKAIRAVVSVPIIGIAKEPATNRRILITPSFEAARELVEAGADILALDCTARGQRYGALKRLGRIKSELRVPVMADIATVGEAVSAVAAGADFVGSTMRGYTADTSGSRTFEPEFISALADAVPIPVIAEGHVITPQQARAAIQAGALVVVVGTAITNPQAITGRFVRALEFEARRRADEHLLGIDLGGTRTKFGVVSSAGKVVAAGAEDTPSGGGREVLLRHLERVARRCLDLARYHQVNPLALGVATAGWVDPYSGRVAYATENLPGWTGAPIAEVLEKAVVLPVAVENDANALAVGERHFGLARNVDNFICLTLGTGVGGGCYINGQLNRGQHFMANSLGHITIERDGLPCTCGQKGCLEAYANAAALVRYAGSGSLKTAEEVVTAANHGDEVAAQAIRISARHLAAGVASIIHLLDPQLVILSGGLTQDNPLLLSELSAELTSQVIAWGQRRVQVRFSQLGYHGGVLGAAAVAWERLERETLRDG